MNEKHAILEQRLRAEQPRFRTSPGFTERVIESLPARSSAAKRRQQPPAALRLLIGLAAAACITLFLLQLLPQNARLPIAPTVSQNQTDTGELIKLPSISVEQVQALTAKLDEPLETELKNVISDTRQAIQLIASNFLPQN